MSVEGCEQCACARLGVSNERRCGRCRTTSWETVRAATGVVTGEPADAARDAVRWYGTHGHPAEGDDGCEHDTSNSEECGVSHTVNGVPQGQCRRCGKCDRWVRAQLVTVAPERRDPLPRRTLWLPGDR